MVFKKLKYSMEPHGVMVAAIVSPEAKDPVSSPA